jgi:hypothetical protein
MRLWMLGDMLIIPTLRNQVVDYIWDTHSTAKVTSLPCLHYVYDNTLSSSPLRRIVVMLYAQNFPCNEYPNYIDDFPKEMLLDLVQLFAKHCNSGYTNLSSTAPPETKESFHVELKLRSRSWPLNWMNIECIRTKLEKDLCIKSRGRTDGSWLLCHQIVLWGLRLGIDVESVLGLGGLGLYEVWLLNIVNAIGIWIPLRCHQATWDGPWPLILS